MAPSSHAKVIVLSPPAVDRASLCQRTQHGSTLHPRHHSLNRLIAGQQHIVQLLLYIRSLLFASSTCLVANYSTLHLKLELSYTEEAELACDFAPVVETPSTLPPTTHP